MTLKVKGIKKQEERPLSNKTGYLVYLYKKLGKSGRRNPQDKNPYARNRALV